MNKALVKFPPPEERIINAVVHTVHLTKGGGPSDYGVPGSMLQSLRDLIFLDSFWTVIVYVLNASMAEDSV